MMDYIYLNLLEQKLPRKEFELTGIDEKKYELKFIQADNGLIISSRIKDEINGMTYKKNISLKEFHKSNKYYKCFDDIGDLFTSYIQTLKESEIKITTKENNINISFLIEFRYEKKEIIFKLEPDIPSIVLNLFEKFKDINLIKKQIEGQKIEIENQKKELQAQKIELNKKINSQEKIINEQKSQIKKQQKDLETQKNLFQNQINELKTQNEKAEKQKEEIQKNLKICEENLVKQKEEINNEKINNKNKINEINQIIDKQKEEINSYKEKIVKLKDENDKIKQLMNNSENEKKQIIKHFNEKIEIMNKFQINIFNEDDFNLVKEGIKNKLNKTIINKNLIYKASKNSFKAKDFHSKCDGKNNTVTFIVSNEGRRFGAFTDEKWDSESGIKKGSNCFVFSLNDNEIYYNKDNNNICCLNNYGPSFGNGGLVIYDNIEKGRYCQDESNLSFETKGKENALAGKYQFNVDEIEIYELNLK